jgi:hypothetical protein
MILAADRCLIALGAVIEFLLCSGYIDFKASPFLQGWLLDAACKGKCHGPRESCHEAGIHGIEMRSGDLWGLTTGEKRDA